MSSRWMNAPREGFTARAAQWERVDLDGLMRAKKHRQAGEMAFTGVCKGCGEEIVGLRATRCARCRTTSGLRKAKPRKDARPKMSHHRGGPGQGMKGVLFVGGYCPAPCGMPVSQHEIKKGYKRCRACRAASKKEAA